MKNIFVILIIVLSLFIGLPTFAQGPQQIPTPNPNVPLTTQIDDWDLKPVKISTEDFLLAGIRFFGMDHNESKLWKEAGLNAFYNDYCPYFRDQKSPHNIFKCRTHFCNLDPECTTPLAPFLTLGMKSINWFTEFGKSEQAYGRNFTTVKWMTPRAQNPLTTDPFGDSPEVLLEEHQILPTRTNPHNAKETGIEASEARYFLASNFDFLGDDGLLTEAKRRQTFGYDLMNNWANKLGHPTSVISGLITIPTFEWYVPNTVNLIDGAFVLKGLQTEGLFVWPYTPKVFCDFIYRIDDLDWNERRPNTGDQNAPLFLVEYYLRYSEDPIDKTKPVFTHTIVTTASDNITFNSSRNFTYTANESEDIKSFPNSVKFQPDKKVGGNPIPAHTYAVQRKVIDYVVDSALGNDPHHKYPIVSIECHLRALSKSGSNPNVGIFIRGLRVRSDLAENILNGNFDNRLLSIFDSKKKALQLAGIINSAGKNVTAWDNLSIFGGGSEPTVDGYRIYAYVDNLCYSRIKKHIIPFLSTHLPDASRPEWFRAIYEEQTGKIPPPISVEDLQKFEQVNMPLPEDGIPYQLKTDPAFVKTDLLKLDHKDQYNHYTNTFQSRFDNNEFPYTFKRCANAINPPWAQGIISEYGKYYAHLSLIASFNGDQQTEKQVDNIKDYCWKNGGGKEKMAEQVLNSIRQELKLPNAPNNEVASLYPKIRMDYMSGNDDNLDFNSLLRKGGAINSKIECIYRAPLRTELRAQAWNAICNGAQGFVFNPIGSDEGGNIGWCQYSWTDESNNSHKYADFDYAFDARTDNTIKSSLNNDHSFRRYFSNASVGSIDNPIVPVATNVTEQGLIDKFTDHIVQSRAQNPGTENNDYDNMGTVYQTIPMFLSDGTEIGENNFQQYIIEHQDKYNTELNNHSFKKKISTNNYVVFPTNDASNWSFIPKVRLCETCTTEYSVATRKEFRPDLPSAKPYSNDGGCFIGDINPDGDHSCVKPFYNRMFRYPDASASVDLYMPTFYGYKETDIGAKRVINDVLPIAQILSKLHWVAEVNYADLFKAGASSATAVWSDFAKFPFLFANDAINPGTQGVNWNYSINWNPDIKSFKFKRTGTPWQLKTANDKANDPLYPDATIDDVNNEKFFDFGLFKLPDSDPSQTIELYVAIANKRTWPIIKKDGNMLGVDESSNGAYQYLGGVDARRLSFKVNPSVFTYGNTSAFTLFDITDLRTGREKMVLASDTFCRDFEPGEGTLLKISPAYSYPIGTTSDLGMAYNNGHRIADVSLNGLADFIRVTTWERAGRINWNFGWVNIPVINYLQNISEGFSLNDGVIRPPQVDAMNPSIACKSDTVAIIYNLAGNTSNNSNAKLSRDVILVIGIARSSTFGWMDFTTIGYTVIDNDVVTDPNQPNQLVTPSITPAKDGFFCAWSKSDNNSGTLANPHYIQPAWVHLVSNGSGGMNVVTQKLQPLQSELATNVFGAISSVFPTVISRDESSCSEDAGIERFHIAWEEQFSSSVGNNGRPVSQIVYTRFNYDNTQPLNSQWTLGSCINGQPLERVSKLAPSCEHHHPNIALTNTFTTGGQVLRAEPRVAWEMVVQKTECIDGGPVWANDVYVATRERNPNWQLCNSWTSFKNFHPKQNNLPLPLIMPGPTPAIGQSAFKDFGVIFQDTITKSIETAKLLRHPNNPKLPWLKKQLLEKGQYPSVAELYTPNPDGLVDAYSFRQINKQIFTDAQNKDHELYTARLTSIPVRDKLSANNTVHEFIAKDRNNECDIKLHFLIGPATVNCCATTINSPLCLCPLSDTVQWEDYDISTGHPGYYSDTTSTGYYWPPTEDSVVTENFNVDTNSYIHIGRILSLSDSSMWKTFLTDSTKYVEVDLLLKDSATKQTIQSIENIKISGSNIFASFLSFLKPSNPCEPEYLSSPAPPTDEFLAYGTDRQIDKKVIVAPPSGKAYLTLSIKKSNNFPLVLAQSQIIQGELELNPKAPLPAQSLKKAVPISNKPSVASRIVLTIHPNPFKTKTDLELDVPNGTPLNITVFDILGHPLSVLVNEISTKDHYSISLESKLLNSGVYLIRVQAGNDVVSRKIEIIK